MLKALGVTVAITTLCGCTSPTANSSDLGATQSPLSIPAEDRDTWARSLQCSDHADRLAMRLKGDNEKSEYDRVQGWTIHYNRKEQRCFIEVGYINPTVKNGQTVRIPTQGLFDAVENLLVATSAYGANEYCSVPGPHRSTIQTDCATAQKFIDEKMTN